MPGTRVLKVSTDRTVCGHFEGLKPLLFLALRAVQFCLKDRRPFILAGETDSREQTGFGLESKRARGKTVLGMAANILGFPQPCPEQDLFYLAKVSPEQNLTPLLEGWIGTTRDLIQRLSAPSLDLSEGLQVVGFDPGLA